jgi:hypothetical protein
VAGGTAGYRSSRGLGYGSGGDAGGTTIGGFAEEEAAGAVLGVGLEFVLDVGDGAGSEVALVERDGAVAVFATELGVSVDESFGDGFDLPEGFVARAGGANAAAFYFTFIQFFGNGDDFGGQLGLS